MLARLVPGFPDRSCDPEHARRARQPSEDDVDVFGDLPGAGGPVDFPRFMLGRWIAALVRSVRDPRAAGASAQAQRRRAASSSSSSMRAGRARSTPHARSSSCRHRCVTKSCRGARGRRSALRAAPRQQRTEQRAACASRLRSTPARRSPQPIASGRDHEFTAARGPAPERGRVQPPRTAAARPIGCSL